MHRVHAHKRFGAWLALTALALQIVLSFGHVHLDGGVRAVAPASFHGAAAQASRQAPAPSPAGDADDYCAICASIYLASTSFVPPAPQLLLPGRFERVEHPARLVCGIAAEPRRAAFQSRAPPLA